MATYKRGQKIEEGILADAIKQHFTGLLDIKTDGHVLLLSCIYAGMPASLETGSDGKSLKYPGNGTHINEFIKQCGGTLKKYIPRLKKFIKDVSPFDVDGDKIRFVEKRFRDMGGDRDVIFDRLCAYDKTWYDHTVDKKDPPRPDVAKKLAGLIKTISAMENLTSAEKAILDGLKAVAAHAKVELPESK